MIRVVRREHPCIVEIDPGEQCPARARSPDLRELATPLAGGDEDLTVTQIDRRRIPAPPVHVFAGVELNPLVRIEIVVRNPWTVRGIATAHDEGLAALESHECRAEHVVARMRHGNDFVGDRIPDRRMRKFVRAGGRPLIGFVGRKGEDASVGEIGHRDGNVRPKEDGSPCATDIRWKCGRRRRRNDRGLGKGGQTQHQGDDREPSIGAQDRFSNWVPGEKKPHQFSRRNPEYWALSKSGLTFVMPLY